MADIVERLTWLSSRHAEHMNDGPRLTDFCHAGREAASVITALRAENTRLRELVQWRPISEAPKDGSDIIAWREGHVAKLAHWEKEQWDLPAGWSMAEPEFAPTHWMPFPPPPTGEQTDE